MSLRVSSRTLKNPYTLSWLDSASLCSRCAQSIIRKSSRGLSTEHFLPSQHIAARSNQQRLWQQRRAYHSHGRAQASVSVTSREDEVDRRFFWANAYHRDKSLNDNDGSQSKTLSGVLGTLGTGAGSRRNASTAAEHLAMKPLEDNEEAPHRRRKRLKEEAAAAANTIAAETETPMSEKPFR